MSPSSSDDSIAELLVQRSPRAEAELRRVCGELSLWVAADHEGALFAGAYCARRHVPRTQYLLLARSWEQFDRAFEPVAPGPKHDLAFARLAHFVRLTGVAGDLGDHCLFVITENDEDTLISLGAEAWDQWLKRLDLSRADGAEASVALRELLQRDPHLLERSPEPDH